MVGTFRVWGLRLDSNLGVRPATGKKFYLYLMVDRMHAFAAFSENFMAAVNFANPKREIQSQYNETEIIGIQI